MSVDSREKKMEMEMEMIERNVLYMGGHICTFLVKIEKNVFDLNITCDLWTKCSRIELGQHTYSSLLANEVIIL